tara:strand:+ start:5886 stop:6092 length:207 start_codon:yes stop_codon:yes gene_type:complete
VFTAYYIVGGEEFILPCNASNEDEALQQFMDGWRMYAATSDAVMRGWLVRNDGLLICTTSRTRTMWDD